VVEPPAFVIVKRRRASIEDAWVIQTLEKWVGQMPVPEGKITSSQIFDTPEVQKELEDVQIPDEPTEVVAEEEPKKK
jgi:hypothetical protein